MSDPDQVLEVLLVGGPLPDEDQAGLQPLADVLAALRQPAAAAELTGQGSALAAFRARPPRTGWLARTRWPRLRPVPVTALAAGAVVVAGLAAGAYQGDLPAPMQQWAHHTFGLTAARSKASPSPGHPRHRANPTPTGPAHHRPGLGRHHQPDHDQQSPHGASQHDADLNKHGRDGAQGSPEPTPASRQGGSSSSSAPTPEPSTSPAVQPSAQSSTAPGPHQSQSAPSSPP